MAVQLLGQLGVGSGGSSSGLAPIALADARWPWQQDFGPDQNQSKFTNKSLPTIRILRAIHRQHDMFGGSNNVDDDDNINNYYDTDQEQAKINRHVGQQAQGDDRFHPKEAQRQQEFFNHSQNALNFDAKSLQQYVFQNNNLESNTNTYANKYQQTRPMINSKIHQIYSNHKNTKPVHVSMNQQTVNGLLSLLLLFIISTCGCIGTIFIMSALTLIESLQTRGNCYLVSLAMSHLLVTLFVIPSSALQIMAGDGINGRTLCHYQWLTLEFVSFVNQLSFLLIAVDNYLGYSPSEKVTTTIENCTRGVSSGPTTGQADPSPTIKALQHLQSQDVDKESHNVRLANELDINKQQLQQQKLTSHQLPTITGLGDLSLTPTVSQNKRPNRLISALLNFVSPSRRHRFASQLGGNNFNLKSNANNSTLANKMQPSGKFGASNQTKAKNKMRLAYQFAGEMGTKVEKPGCLGYKNFCGRLKVLIWICFIWAISFAYTIHQHELSYGPKFCSSSLSSQLMSNQQQQHQSVLVNNLTQNQNHHPYHQRMSELASSNAQLRSVFASIREEENEPSYTTTSNQSIGTADSLGQQKQTRAITVARNGPTNAKSGNRQRRHHSGGSELAGYQLIEKRPRGSIELAAPAWSSKRAANNDERQSEIAAPTEGSGTDLGNENSGDYPRRAADNLHDWPITIATEADVSQAEAADHSSLARPLLFGPPMGTGKIDRFWNRYGDKPAENEQKGATLAGELDASGAQVRLESRAGLGNGVMIRQQRSEKTIGALGGDEDPSRHETRLNTSLILEAGRQLNTRAGLHYFQISATGLKLGPESVGSKSAADQGAGGLVDVIVGASFNIGQFKPITTTNSHAALLADGHGLPEQRENKAPNDENDDENKGSALSGEPWMREGKLRSRRASDSTFKCDSCHRNSSLIGDVVIPTSSSGDDNKGDRQVTLVRHDFITSGNRLVASGPGRGATMINLKGLNREGDDVGDELRVSLGAADEHDKPVDLLYGQSGGQRLKGWRRRQQQQQQPLGGRLRPTKGSSNVGRNSGLVPALPGNRNGGVHFMGNINDVNSRKLGNGMQIIGADFRPSVDITTTTLADELMDGFIELAGRHGLRQANLIELAKSEQRRPRRTAATINQLVPSGGGAGGSGLAPVLAQTSGQAADLQVNELEAKQRELKRFYWPMLICAVILPSLISTILFTRAYLRMKEFKMRPYKPMPVATLVSTPPALLTPHSPIPLIAQRQLYTFDLQDKKQPDKSSLTSYINSGPKVVPVGTGDDVVLDNDANHSDNEPDEDVDDTLELNANKDQQHEGCQDDADDDDGELLARAANETARRVSGAAAESGTNIGAKPADQRRSNQMGAPQAHGHPHVGHAMSAPSACPSNDNLARQVYQDQYNHHQLIQRPQCPVAALVHNSPAPAFVSSKLQRIYDRIPAEFAPTDSSVQLVQPEVQRPQPHQPVTSLNLVHNHQQHRATSFSAPPSATFRQERFVSDDMFQVEDGVGERNSPYSLEQRQQEHQHLSDQANQRVVRQRHSSPVDISAGSSNSQHHHLQRQQSHNFRRHQAHAHSFHYGTTLRPDQFHEAYQQQQRPITSVSSFVGPDLAAANSLDRQQRLLERHRSLPRSSRLYQDRGCEHLARSGQTTSGNQSQRLLAEASQDAQAAMTGVPSLQQRDQSSHQSVMGTALANVIKSIDETSESNCRSQEDEQLRRQQQYHTQTSSQKLDDVGTLQTSTRTPSGGSGGQDTCTSGKSAGRKGPKPVALSQVETRDKSCAGTSSNYNQSKQQQRQQQQANKVILCTYSYMTDDQLLKSNIVVFVVNLTLWLPFILLTVAQQYRESLTQELKDAVWWLATLNCCSCSYIYALTNKDFREAFNKLFYYCCCKSHVTFQRKTPIFRRQLDMDSNGNLRVHIIPGLNVYSNKLSKGPTVGHGNGPADHHHHHHHHHNLAQIHSGHHNVHHHHQSHQLGPASGAKVHHRHHYSANSSAQIQQHPSAGASVSSCRPNGAGGLQQRRLPRARLHTGFGGPLFGGGPSKPFGAVASDSTNI